MKKIEMSKGLKMIIDCCNYETLDKIFGLSQRKNINESNDFLGVFRSHKKGNKSINVGNSIIRYDIGDTILIDGVIGEYKIVSMYRCNIGLDNCLPVDIEKGTKICIIR